MTQKHLPRGRLGPSAAMVFLVLVAGCATQVSRPSTAPGPTGPPRVFRMGMTPFPAEGTIGSFMEAVDFAGTHGDFISNHHDDGVPWDSMLAGGGIPPGALANYTYRRDRGAQLGARTYVSVTLLNQDRDSLAYGFDFAPWPAEIASDPSFANPRVRAALKRWCASVASFYQPDWFSPGIEINFYETHQPADWANLVSFYRDVYDTLKSIRPGMQVFPTFQIDHMRGQAQWAEVAAFEDRMDAMAVSAYPGLGGFTPYTLPADYLSQAITATGSARPLVISETGYGDSTVLFTPGSPQMQRDYLAWITAEADSIGIAQVTWFFPSNIWAIYEAAPQPIVLFFAPMGLRTRTLQPKPVLSHWDSTLGRDFRPGGPQPRPFVSGGPVR